MKRRIALFVLVFALVLFSGCGKEPNESGGITITPQGQSQSEQTVPEQNNGGEQEQEVPSGDNSEAPSANGSSGSENAAKPENPSGGKTEDEENPGEESKDEVADPMGGIPGPESSNVDKAPEVNKDGNKYPEGSNYLIVDTKYGDLFYQDQWIEFMRTEKDESGKSVSVSFKAEINGKLYPLFDITVGEANGTFAGTTKGDDGKERNVYVRINDLGDISGLTEGEQDRLYAMQEEVNYILNNLK